MSFAQEFLRYPDLFPRRLSGEKCGSESLAIDFVGGPLVVAGLAHWQQRVVGELWDGLCRPPLADEEPHFQVFRAAPDDFLEIDLRAWPNTLDFSYEQELVRFAGRHCLGVLELPRGRIRRGALWTAAAEELEFAGVFENFFRVALAYRLLELGGVLLHSAAVVDEGRACVFVGPSGAGKSTLSRLSLEGSRTVLSDDLNALVPAPFGLEGGDGSLGGSLGGGFVVERLPFAGDLRRPGRSRLQAPLAGLFSLEKAIQHEVREASSARGLATLLAAAPFVNRDPLRAERLEQVLLSLFREPSRSEAPGAQALASPVPFAHLRFSRHDDGFWLEIRAHLDSRSTSDSLRRGTEPSRVREFTGG